MNLKEAVVEVLEARGKTIIDVGCGDGAIVRHLTRLGGKVFGVEIAEQQLARALSAEAAGGESYHVGSGEALPFDDTVADAVLYLNSLHHVPVDAMDAALEEAARVLKRDGQLIVIEPLAAGSYFETMRPIEDETEVRAEAYRRLLNPPLSLTSEGETVYETILRFRDVNHFLQAVTAPDPARREKLPLVEDELRRRFDANAGRDADGFLFTAPMRRNVLRSVKS
jgi:ubiquinone/menaquinone biosynthesis C-methylase UbiE